MDEVTALKATTLGRWRIYWTWRSAHPLRDLLPRTLTDFENPESEKHFLWDEWVVYQATLKTNNRHIDVLI